MPEKAKNAAALQAALNGIWRNPMRLRIALAVVLAGVWYGGIYRPLVGQIESTRADLDTERKRIAMAEVIEGLRAQTKRFHDRLPPRADPNEEIQYLLDGVKALPVRLVSLNPMPPKEMEPYKTVAVRLQAEGRHPDLDRLLRWLEGNRRILRIEEITIEPADEGKATKAGQARQYKMDLIIMGVIG
jgi:hypothetical protein